MAECKGANHLLILWVDQCRQGIGQVETVGHGGSEPSAFPPYMGGAVGIYILDR